MKALFSGAGWRVFEAKYGIAVDRGDDWPARRRPAPPHRRNGNEEYQALIRIKDGAELRRRLTDVADPEYRQAILASVADIPDDELQRS